MNRPSLAVCLDDLQRDVRTAMDRARDLGFRAIDVGATSGPVSVRELSRTGQRHLLRHLGDLGLRLSSLRGPCGQGSYTDGATGERRLEEMRGVIGLAAGLRVPVVSTTLGMLAMEGNAAGNTESRLKETLITLANEADRSGVAVAIETVGLSAGQLAKWLRAVDCPLLTAACDTGAMLMQGEDPHRIAETIGGRLGLVRARDAVAAAGGGYEVPMGTGGLSPEHLLGNLAEAAYEGDIVLTRTTGDDRANDLRKAKARFDALLGQ